MHIRMDPVKKEYLTADGMGNEPYFDFFRRDEGDGSKGQADAA